MAKRFKRSTTEKFDIEGNKGSPQLFKSKMNSLLNTVDLERKLNSKTPGRSDIDNSFIEQNEHHIIDYRRQGVDQNGLRYVLDYLFC